MGHNHLIPELLVSDFGKSLKFYKSLGFLVDYERTKPAFAFLSFERSQIMLQQMGEINEWEIEKPSYPFGRGINFQIYIKDLDFLWKSLDKEVRIIAKPEISIYKADDKEIKHKELVIADPDGYLLRFAQQLN